MLTSKVEDDTEMPHVQMLYEPTRFTVSGEIQLTKESRLQLNKIKEGSDSEDSEESFELVGPERIIISPNESYWYTNKKYYKILSIFCLNNLMADQFYRKTEKSNV